MSSWACAPKDALCATRLADLARPAAKSLGYPRIDSMNHSPKEDQRGTVGLTQRRVCQLISYPHPLNGTTLKCFAFAKTLKRLRNDICHRWLAECCYTQEITRICSVASFFFQVCVCVAALGVCASWRPARHNASWIFWRQQYHTQPNICLVTCQFPAVRANGGGRNVRDRNERSFLPERAH